ncbi:ARL14 effector protein-like [Drosophila innubila]|uniref:ARL14 effector protein-like n=1 Tax=Drosophila innubila TaxID=198719 RepID=UPI00148C62FA|nr:ARL14 effector protein-like [Drosophila innubila]
MSARSLRQRPQRKVGETADDNTNTEVEKTKRKGKKRGCYYEKKNSAYDEYGNIRWSGADVCDCMNDECCGCWSECGNCGSTRCGPQCRVHRKFFYENIIYDGKELTVSNKNIPSKT